jgi:hypothetical protein
MRRSVTFSLAWVCAAGAATFAAGQGVALVTHAVTSDRPSAFTAAQVDGKVADLGPSATTAPPATTTTSPSVPDATSTTTTAPSAPSETHTYNLTGGTATFRFSPDGVTVVAAVPNSGFTTTTEPESENGFAGIRVQFESDGHRSRITAWWDGGPQVDPREQSR